MDGIVRRYIDFLILFIPIYSTYISSFLQQHPYFFVNFFFSFLHRNKEKEREREREKEKKVTIDILSKFTSLAIIIH